jgi:hypothetical protein
MNKRFAIQHIWFNNQDPEVTLVGRIQDDTLTYESKLIIKMSQLNGIISKIQQAASIEASDYMCRFELGFITEYEISFPERAQQFIDVNEVLGAQQSLVRKIVA